MASKSRSSSTRNAPVTRSSPTARPATARTSIGQRPANTVRGGTRNTVVPQARNSAGRLASARTHASQPDPAPAETGIRLAPAWLQWTTFVLALIGLAVSAYLTYTHFSETKLLGCAESGLVNCEKVTTSPQSYVFGIPVAVLGLAFYAFAVAIMSPWAWRMTRREVAVVRVVSLVIGIGFVIYLLYAELYIIDNICLYCTSVHIVTFGLFVLTVFAAAVWGLRPPAPAARSLLSPEPAPDADPLT